MSDLDFSNLIIGKTGSGKTYIHHLYLFLRTVRIKNNELLLNMAEKMELGVAELSSIEQGKAPIPKGFFAKIFKLYDLPIEFGDIELWETMEQSLYMLKQEHIGQEAIPSLELVILALVVRYESGERSSDLHAQILDLEYKSV